MAREAARIRSLVWSCGPRGRGARLREDVRREVIAFARAQRDHGVGVRELAVATGVSPESIRRWTSARQTTSRAARALVPVTLRSEYESQLPTVTVRSPGGYVVDGLTIEQAATLLRQLA